MHLTINVKSPNNISKWQMGFNSAFKGLNYKREFTVELKANFPTAYLSHPIYQSNLVVLKNRKTISVRLSISDITSKILSLCLYVDC
jgi:hypothetical protein